MEQSIKGGEFLIKDVSPNEIFIPEDFNEEQSMLAGMCKEFLEKEIYPNVERIDHMEEGLMASLIDKAGELGILGLAIPEEYGGLNAPFVTTMLATEVLGAGYSFAVAMNAHTGIGTLPILYYGNKAQKDKYIPKLATGEWKACYCLTEPGSGSDANSGKTKAKLSADGKHYILDGQKMWITNSGFADIFVVFAKIDDDENLTGFIVEKSFGGIELNPEEKKMGIKGSSTRQVFFNNCMVPVENLLGERQGGFKIALNILNIGRIKLSAATNGAAKMATTLSVNYANERSQFGRPISKYGAIRSKMADQAIRTWVNESANYRAAQNIEDAIEGYLASGMDESKAILKGIEQFAAECAILKVHGSEVLDFVVDEGVQIHGGMGYSAESAIERAYRDSRINRIFEGTNEINRMLTVDMILKKAMKGELDLMTPAMAVQKELMSIPDFGEEANGPLDNEIKYVKNFKKAILMVAGAAVQKLMMTLSKEQEILMGVANMIIEVYAAESALLRALKLIDRNGVENSKYAIAIVKTYVYDTADKINKFGKDALNNFADGDEHRMMLLGLKRFTKTEPLNTKETRQLIAQKLIEENRYCF